MRKLLLFSLCVNIATVLGIGLLWREAQVDADVRRAAVEYVNSADVNADERIDISDVVYTLNWLFGVGPTPVPVDCAPVPLPATGQTKCRTSDGDEIDCWSLEAFGQDGFYQTGCPTAERFTDNGDGTVTDACTGLMWQKDTADGNLNGTVDALDVLTWRNALSYCENLNMAGHDDWRMPSMRELRSIIDFGHTEPCMHPSFVVFLDNYYWSSTTYLADPALSWCVAFGAGTDYQGSKMEKYYVRAVRSSQ